MKVRQLTLCNHSALRPYCSWANCYRTAGHSAAFEMHTRRGWKPRHMGLCDHHRGLFRKKHCKKR